MRPKPPMVGEPDRKRRGMEGDGVVMWGGGVGGGGEGAEGEGVGLIGEGAVEGGVGGGG